MKDSSNKTAPRNKSLIRIAVSTAFILMIPLIAMQFTEEVNWELGDFLIIGALLLSTGLIYEFVVRKMTDTTHRIIAATALAVILFLIWAELAVGLVEKLLTGTW
jgi:hypothetical protein